MKDSHLISKRLFQSLIFLLLLACVQLACKTSSQLEKPISENIYQIEKAIKVNSAAVVSAHPEATKIGVAILRQGGNAIDAAISVQFALAVCYPVAGNIGGGGFMVYRNQHGEFHTLDYREKAPGLAHSDMYLDESGNPIQSLSLNGHLAAGVPGSVDGMEQAFKKFSQLKDWGKLLQPSIDLARNGFKLTEAQARGFNRSMARFKKYNTTINAVTQKTEWSAGELFIQEDLARTLEAIRDQGRDGFYKGLVAAYIVAEMDRGNGIITLEDLANYQSQWRKPIEGAYKNYKIISMAPPSSGGIVLVQMLKMIEPYNIGQYDFHSEKAVHLMVEAEKRAFADRAKHLGDADFYPVPQKMLLDEDYIKSRMQDFSFQKASPAEDISAGYQLESEETTHFSIIDAEGNAVSITTTLNGGYGSKVFVGQAGFLLNNEMDDFSVKPGHPNLYGLIGAEANKIEPGKRMLSSMTPSIVEENGELRMIVGTPGGSTIITSVFQVILNCLEFKMNVNDAVQAPRFHNQWKPDFVFAEQEAIKDNTRMQLEKLGHSFSKRGAIGRVEAIWVNKDGTIEAAADHRGDDHAAGY